MRRKLAPHKRKLLASVMTFRLLVVPLRLDTRHDHQITQAWSKPDEGWIKINVDAAFLENSYRVWVGFVSCNHLGEVVITCARHIQKLFPVWWKIMEDL
jgi:hypothetical protein